MSKRKKRNKRINADKVRVVDKEGEQLGILPFKEALKKAKEEDLDLIEVAPNAKPPVCKIGDYSKYLYRKQKKEKKQRSQKGGELKNIRVGFNISDHDLQTKMKKAQKFLNNNNKVRLEMRLRGRENALKNTARDKIKKFLEELDEETPIKIEKKLKKRPRGFSVIIAKST